MIAAVAGRRPVSAALGEFGEHNGKSLPLGLSFVKWGLRSCGLARTWRQRLSRACRWVRGTSPGCEPVAVAYADWAAVAGIRPTEVCDFAAEQRLPALLVDTCRKDGRTLLDVLDEKELEDVCGACRRSGIKVALAGSLTAAEIVRLRGLAPDWFAVRGAACRGGRGGEVEASRVRDLVAMLS